MNEPLPEEQAQRIKEALFAGRKIEAIKLFREQTQLGLAESKAFVEQMEERLRGESPALFAKPPTKGCMTVILALLTVVGFIYAVR